EVGMVREPVVPGAEAESRDLDGVPAPRERPRGDLELAVRVEEGPRYLRQVARGILLEERGGRVCREDEPLGMQGTARDLHGGAHREGRERRRLVDVPQRGGRGREVRRGERDRLVLSRP